MLKRFFLQIRRITQALFSNAPTFGQAPQIVPRSGHTLSRKAINDNALKVLGRLHNNGFKAYLVGGGVRDGLLGMHPKDFDVVTDAKPEEVKKLFRNCRLIGRRFRLAHVFFGQEIIEVATFRALVEKGKTAHQHSEDGMILSDNEYGTMEEDAWRRDFTINALYYNIADFSLVDYTQGLKDLKYRHIRMIGDSQERIKEDPVRMLRAIRFSAKLNFSLCRKLDRAIKKQSALLKNVPNARLFEEALKLFKCGASVKVFELLRRYQLFPLLFPLTHQALTHNKQAHQFLMDCFKNTDVRLKEKRIVTPSFLFACILWHYIQDRAQSSIQKGQRVNMAYANAIDDALKEQIQFISLPKKIGQGLKEILMLQVPLERPFPYRVHSIFNHPKFKASYDFLLLRAKTDPKLKTISQWWTQFLNSNDEQRSQLIKSLPKRKRPPRKKAHRE